MRSRAGKKLKSCQKRKVVPKSRSRAKQVEVVPKKGEVVPNNQKSCQKNRSRAKKVQVVPKTKSRADKQFRSRFIKIEVVKGKLKRINKWP